jgi:hypothetical protein
MQNVELIMVINKIFLLFNLANVVIKLIKTVNHIFLPDKPHITGIF